MTSIEQYLTVEEVGQRLRVSHWTVRRLVALGKKTGGTDGIWPAVRIKSLVRIPESALRRYVQKLIKWA